MKMMRFLNTGFTCPFVHWLSWRREASGIMGKAKATYSKHKEHVAFWRTTFFLKGNFLDNLVKRTFRVEGIVQGYILLF
jgi:hypothetical protein